MGRCLLFVLVLLFCHTAPVLSHAPVLLDSRHATPGLRIVLRRLGQVDDSTEAKYQIRAFGFPKGVKLLFWAKEFDHSFHQLASVFQVDSSGNVLEAKPSVAQPPRKLDEMIFGPGAYPRGAIWELALVSIDRKLQAFTKVTPYPIIFREGSCEIDLILASHRGEKFVVFGTGFPPGDEVNTSLRYAGRVIEKRVKTSADGSLPSQVLLHASVNTNRQAQYIVKAPTCEVKVDYQWGEAALKRDHENKTRPAEPALPIILR